MSLLPNFKANEQGFKPVPNHKGFIAKLIPSPFEASTDVRLAEIAVEGGGPIEETTHEHDHIFIVLEGQITVDIAGAKYLVEEEHSIYVEGQIPHSIWNTGNKTAHVIGVNI